VGQRQSATGRAADLAERHASELRAIAGALPDLFAEAASVLEEQLGEGDLDEWAQIGLALARRAPHSRYLTAVFFAASPSLGHLGIAALSKWAEMASGLVDRAAQAAAAFLEATPAVLEHLEPEELELWSRQGRRLYRGSWKSVKLAASFFRISPDLLESVPLRTLDRFVDVLDRLAQSSPEMASACLYDAPAQLARLAESDREPFLAFTQAVCRASWVDAHHCLERGPGLLEAVQAEQRSALLELAAIAAPATGRDCFSLFAASTEALSTLAPTDQAEVIEMGRRLAPHGARAAIESVVSAPEVRRRLTSAQAKSWSEAGLELLIEGRNLERAESYFRLESALAEEMLSELAERVELASVGIVLRLYAKAISGEEILVQPTGALARRNIGWQETEAPTSDGTSVFLPPEVELFGDRRANFEVYKVYTTHQTGRLEFGSFRFCFGEAGEHLGSTLVERERQRIGARDAAESRPPAIIPMQRLYDLFDDRRLASELFALAEDSRIDARIVDEYPGIRRWLQRLQGLEAEQRPNVRLLPLRQAFVENLVRASLGQPDTIRWPLGLAARLGRAIATLRLVAQEGATVQDSAEVAARLYDLAIAIPNLPPHRVPVEWGELDADAIARASGLSGDGLEGDEELPEGEEVAYQGPGHPEYRGAFKPELVQLLDELINREEGAEDGMPLTRQQIREMLESSAELELSEAGDDEDADLEVLLADIEREVADRTDEEEGDDDEAGDDSEEQVEWFHYDEWDFRVSDYRPGWCRVGERTAVEGEIGFYEETLRRYHGLVVETRRQFERMRPESFRLLKRLEDGHEIDFDQAIEFHVDKKAGAGPLARFYTRRNKVRRDVAVAFLLDMSGSTSEQIGQSAALPASRGASGVRHSAPSWVQEEKRIIDVERESTVLVIEALEAIGDAYGIYGFSGHGRENVEFHVIKDLDEPFDDAVRRRVGGIEPISSTRMGPAIRHAITKLNDHEARAKILIFVSDGRPQDDDYGRDRSEREYAVHDTKRALIEAKRQRITPYLITVDSAGHDYLRYMCDDMGYEVVANIESLPHRLPKLYRYLAAE